MGSSHGFGILGWIGSVAGDQERERKRAFADRFLGGGFNNFFLCFTPKIGVSWSILTSMCFKLNGLGNQPPARFLLSLWWFPSCGLCVCMLYACGTALFWRHISNSKRCYERTGFGTNINHTNHWPKYFQHIPGWLCLINIRKNQHNFGYNAESCCESQK